MEMEMRYPEWMKECKELGGVGSRYIDASEGSVCILNWMREME